MPSMGRMARLAMPIKMTIKINTFAFEFSFLLSLVTCLRGIVANGTGFSGISGKEDNLEKYSQILSFHLILLPEFRNFRLNGSHFVNITIFGFSGNFPRKLSVRFASVSKVPGFLIEWEAPRISLKNSLLMTNLYKNPYRVSDWLLFVRENSKPRNSQSEHYTDLCSVTSSVSKIKV